MPDEIDDSFVYVNGNNDLPSQVLLKKELVPILPEDSIALKKHLCRLSKNTLYIAKDTIID